MKLFRSQIYNPDRPRSCILSATLVGLALFVAAGVASAQMNRLVHTPVTSATAGKSLHVETTIQTAGPAPVEGWVYFRDPTAQAFDNAELDIRQDIASGDIPAESVVEGQLEYYIQVNLSDGSVIAYPPGAPDESEPLQVDVKPVGAGGQSAVVVLSPEPGAKLDDPDVLIAVSFLQNILKIDPAQVRIEVDGANRTRRASVNEAMLTLVIDNMRPGNHNVVLTHGGDRLVDWSFRVSTPQQARRLPGNMRGSVTGGYSHENISSSVRNITYLDGRFSGNVNDVEWNGRGYITSLERGYLQSQNRFLAKVRYGGLTVRGGDTQPRFSEFTLWGVRTRGAQLALTSPVINLDFAWGNLLRSVEGNQTWEVVTGVAGDTLKSQVNPTEDSLRAVTDPGTFSRRLLAVRPGFPLSKHSKLSFTVVKAKDDVESIDFGAAPKDNLVVGTDLHIQSNNRRVMFNWESAISLYNRDISSGPMSDAADVENIIVVNQYFEPLPNDSSVLESGIGQGELVSKLFKEIMKSSAAHRFYLTLNYFRNEFKVGYKSIGKSFRSLGSPTVYTDVKGISIQDRMRLLNNRLYLTLGYEGYSDNVNGRSETTLDRSIIRFAVSYYSPPEYPNLNFGVRSHNRKNDGTLSPQPLPDNTVDTLDTRIDNNQTNLNFAVDQAFQFGGFDHVASLAYNGSSVNDDIVTTAESDISTLSLNLTSRKDDLLRTGVTLNSTRQKSLGGDYDIGYTDLGFNANYTLTPNVLWVNGGLNFTFAGGGNDNLGPLQTGADSSSTPKALNVDFTRIKFSVGADYTPSLQHSFSLRAYKVSHSDDSNTEFYDGHQVFSKDSPGYRDQNDLVARLTYTYTF